MPDDLENELARLTPLPPSSRLDDRIRAALPYREPEKGRIFSLSDALLRLLLTAGVAAALTIIVLVSQDYWPASHPVPALSEKTPDTLTIADTPRLLAQLSDSKTSADLASIPQHH